MCYRTAVRLSCVVHYFDVIMRMVIKVLTRFIIRDRALRDSHSLSVANVDTVVVSLGRDLVLKHVRISLVVSTQVNPSRASYFDCKKCENRHFYTSFSDRWWN